MITRLLVLSTFLFARVPADAEYSWFWLGDKCYGFGHVPIRGDALRKNCSGANQTSVVDSVALLDAMASVQTASLRNCSRLWVGAEKVASDEKPAYLWSATRVVVPEVLWSSSARRAATCVAMEMVNVTGYSAKTFRLQDYNCSDMSMAYLCQDLTKCAATSTASTATTRAAAISDDSTAADSESAADSTASAGTSPPAAWPTSATATSQDVSMSATSATSEQTASADRTAVAVTGPTMDVMWPQLSRSANTAAITSPPHSTNTTLSTATTLHVSTLSPTPPGIIKDFDITAQTTEPANKPSVKTPAAVAGHASTPQTSPPARSSESPATNSADVIFDPTSLGFAGTSQGAPSVRRPTSQHDATMCACFCLQANRQNPPDSNERDLVVEKSSLSKQVRKHTSAPDWRPSAVAAGTVGMALLVTVSVIIMAPDLVQVLRYLLKPAQKLKRHSKADQFQYLDFKKKSCITQRLVF